MNEPIPENIFTANFAIEAKHWAIRICRFGRKAGASLVGHQPQVPFHGLANAMDARSRWLCKSWTAKKNSSLAPRNNWERQMLEKRAAQAETTLLCACVHHQCRRRSLRLDLHRLHDRTRRGTEANEISFPQRARIQAATDHVWTGKLAEAIDESRDASWQAISVQAWCWAEHCPMAMPGAVGHGEAGCAGTAGPAYRGRLPLARLVHALISSVVEKRVDAVASSGGEKTDQNALES